MLKKFKDKKIFLFKLDNNNNIDNIYKIKIYLNFIIIYSLYILTY